LRPWLCARPRKECLGVRGEIVNGYVLVNSALHKPSNLFVEN
jgi:hypothetical protein